MAITRQQLENLGFFKDKRKHLNMHHYALIYPINETDYLFSGYDKVTKKANFKILWISKKILPNERVTHPIAHMGELTYYGVKEYIENLQKQEKLKQDARDNQQD